MPLADPGFSGWGAPCPEFGIKTYYLTIFAENCLKMKETGPRREVRVPSAPLGSANGYAKIKFSFVNQTKPNVCALFTIGPCKGVTNLIFMLLEDLWIDMFSRDYIARSFCWFLSIFSLVNFFRFGVYFSIGCTLVNIHINVNHQTNSPELCFHMYSDLATCIVVNITRIVTYSGTVLYQTFVI